MAGIGVDACVVERPLAQVGVVADALPRGSGIVGLEHPAFFGLYYGVDAVAVVVADGYADFAQDAFWQAGVARDVGPGFAAIGAFPESASLAAAVEGVWSAPGCPCGGVERIGVLGIEADIQRAGSLIYVEHLAPGLAAIGGFVDAAFLAGHPDFAERGDPDGVWIGGVDARTADGVGFFQPQVLPGFALVIAAVDAVAVGDVSAQGVLAHAHVHDVGV